MKKGLDRVVKKRLQLYKDRKEAILIFTKFLTNKQKEQKNERK